MPAFLTPHSIQNLLPLSSRLGQKIKGYRHSIIEILQGKDPRLLLIAGPCSIHNVEASLEYAKKLALLSEEVGDVFMVVMRTYLEKSRTTTGWKGFLSDPFLDGSHDIQTGIQLSRKFLLDVANMDLPAAHEFLDPLASSYISDLISWGSIGARTCQSPTHRELAASLPMPVGFKNRTDGNIDVAIQGCLTAKEEHHYLGMNADGTLSRMHASGNSYPHIVLRGSDTRSNYDATSIESAKEKLTKAGLFPSLIVDCSHGNSNKNHLEQAKVFTTLLTQSIHTNLSIRGIMLESFLHEGSSKEQSVPTVSFTDPCLDWNRTEALIRQGALLFREKVLEPCT